MASDLDGEPLGLLLAAFGPLDLVRLPGIGWLQVKRYAGSVGRDPKTGERVEVPAKRLPFFIAEGAQEREREFESETVRFLTALHPDGDFDGEEEFEVHRTGQTDALAAAIRAQLAAEKQARIAGVGVFELHEHRGTERLRFAADDELKRRLNPS